MRLAALAFATMLVAVTAAIWLTFPASVREQFTTFQRLTVLFLGGLLFAAGFALARCRVDLDADGVLVVNGYRSYRYEWSEVVDVSLRPGAPWAVLDLADGTTRPAMGIQGSDGGRAVGQVALLRELIQAHAGREPGAPL